jgi:hypothetical protein
MMIGVLILSFFVLGGVKSFRHHTPTCNFSGLYALASDERRSLVAALVLGPPYIFLAKEAVSKLNRKGLTYAPSYTTHVQQHLSPFVAKASTILEIGAGTSLWSLREAGIYGANSGADVTFLDPVAISDEAKEAASKVFKRTPKFLAAPISSDLALSPDLVISVFTLCSVSDLESSVRSIYALLPPGSTYAFVEHVIAPQSTPYRAMQEVLTPLQARLAENCHLDRETPRIIEKVFGNLEGRVVREGGMWPVAEVFYGYAVK